MSLFAFGDYFVFGMPPKRRRDQPLTVALQVVVDVGASSGLLVGEMRKYDLVRSLVESLAFEEEADLELGLVFCGSDETRNPLEGYDNTEVVFTLRPLPEASAALQTAFSGPSSRAESDLFGSLVVALDSLAQKDKSFRVLLLITDGVSAIDADDAEMFQTAVLPGVVESSDLIHVVIVGGAANANTKGFLSSVALSTGGRVLEGASSAADCHQLLAHILAARRPENSSHSNKLAKKPPLPLYFPLPLPCGSQESTHSGWDWRHTAAKESWADPRLSGKWLLFEHHFGGTAGLLKAWHALLDAFETGRLGTTMKISDVGQRTSGGSSVMCVYTPNHRDMYDVLRVLLTLRRVVGVQGRLDYKTDDATRENSIPLFSPDNPGKPAFAANFCKYHSPAPGQDGVVSLRLNNSPSSKPLTSTLVTF